MTVNNDYFLGLDIGTDSIGWAVTDKEYKLKKFKGKAMWGVHLFDVGNTAVERRAHRSSRRRYARTAKRREYLREFFRDEISNIDPGFFDRLDDSFFVPDDKREHQKNTLFNDKNYNDKDYYKEYPTVYHLRKRLMECNDKFDIRLIYLAVEHMLKHRGNFLREGMDLDSCSDFSVVFREWCSAVYDTLGWEVSLTDTKDIESVLKTPMGTNEKKKKIKSIFGCKDAAPLLELLSGAKVQVSKIFGDEYKDIENKSISFSESGYDEKVEKLAEEIGDDYARIIDLTKELYNWGILADMLRGRKNISQAKADIYDEHRSDLALLKSVIKELVPEKYNDMFKSEKVKNNYPAYIGKTKISGKKRKHSSSENHCLSEDFNKYVKSVISKYDTDERVKLILDKIEKGTFMPKQVSKDNSTIPYQLNMAELEIILKNAAEHYDFLNKADEYGTVADKIKSLLTFRIPYYVGPLNAYHKKYAWIEKKENISITPWNFYDVVDTEKSAENFIERMTNRCTYLTDEPVLAKNSITYSKFTLFNELNNLKVNGEKLPHELKMKLYNEIFLKTAKPSIKKIKAFIKSYTGEDCTLTGIDEEFKADMRSYIEIRKIIGEKIDNESMVDDIVRLIVIFGTEKKMLIKRISALYGGELSESEITGISKLNYSGWGRLSSKLLNGIFYVNEITGECKSILDLMMSTDENFMQIINNDKYGINEKLKAERAKRDKLIGAGTYESVKELYASPANKKRIWRVMVVVKEIVKAMGCEPAKIFIEMARGDEEKARTVSRKNQLVQLYKHIKADKNLLESLEGQSEDSLKAKKLYLYYCQLGRCMYSGKKLDLSELINCDIDHIIPRSAKKDDSVDNTVLVLKTLNGKKSDTYPIPQDVVSAEARSMWDILLEKGLISKEKFSRLVRKTPLTIEEKTDFIARQLVDTRQTTKLVADIFTAMYPSSEIVYVKAGNVSQFRNGGYLKKSEKEQYSDDRLVKVREINDYHHAKDAYLNIVAGNIFNEKFNHNPRVFVESGKRYNLDRVFEYDVPAASWTGGHDGTINSIKAVMKKNNIIYTRMTREETGGLFDQQLMRKGGGQYPIKTSDKRFENIGRYGGYNKVSGAYFALVRHIKKGKSVKSFETVPVYIRNTVENDPAALQNYFLSAGLENAEVLIPKIKFGTLLKMDGSYVRVTGRSNDRILISNSCQLVLSEKYERYIKRIVKYNSDTAQSAIEEDKARGIYGIEKEANLELYDVFTEKLKTNVYRGILGAQIKNLEEARGVFVNLDTADQCKVLSEILHFFTCNSMTADISLLGKGGQAGKLGINKFIQKCTELKIIYQSAAGLYENEVDVLAL